MKEDILQDNLNWLLLQVLFRTKTGLIKLSDEYHLTVMQAVTLCLLKPNEPIPMHLISTMLACDASNVTGIVDRLVTIEYIDRKPSSTDRRVNIISLTEQGATVRSDFFKQIKERGLPNLNALSAEETKQLKSLLKKILAK